MSLSSRCDRRAKLPFSNVPFAEYVRLEGTIKGYYIVFDHRHDPEPRVETERIDDVRSSVIPVVQERPSESLYSRGLGTVIEDSKYLSQ